MSNVSSSNSQGVRVPKLRFPGFEGEWDIEPLSKFLIESKIPGSDGKQAKKLSVKLWAKGVVEKNTVFEGSENTQYYIRKAGQLMYGKLDFLNCAFGIVPPELDGYESTLDAPAFDISNIDSTFLLNKIIQRNFYKKNGDIANGSRKAKRIHPDTFLEMEIAFPGLKEQAKIAEFITYLNTRIEKQRQLVELLKSYKRGVLSKLFPKNGENTPEYRFAGFTEPWKQRKIKELFKITRGYVLATSMTNDRQTERTPYPVYSSQTKSEGLMGYYSQYLYEKAITWTTDGANAGTVNFRDGKFYCTNVCGVLLADSVVPDQMISEALNCVAKNHVSYVGNPKLMNNVMAEITLTLPESEKERQVISALLSFYDNLISSHKQKLDELQSLKSGLLQQLFI